MSVKAEARIDLVERRRVFEVHDVQPVAVTAEGKWSVTWWIVCS